MAGKKKNTNKSSGSVVADLKGKGINLLSDIGLAARQAQLRRRVNQICILIVVGMVIISVASFGFWFTMNKQQRDIEGQIETLEQKLTALSETARLVDLYQTRLQKIRQIVQVKDESKIPGFLHKKLVEIADRGNCRLTSFQYDPQTLGGKFEVSKVQDLNQVMNDLDDEQQNEGVWKNVQIRSLTRNDLNEYEFEFESDLVSKVEE